MRVAVSRSTKPSQAAATTAQLTLRSALASYLHENNSTDLIEALKTIENEATRSTIQSVVNQALIQRLIKMLKDNEGSRNTSVMIELIDLLGRFDRLLGWQTGKAYPTQQHLDQMAQSLIDELETIDSIPRHPLAMWRDYEPQDPSRTPHTDFLAPWPATLSQTLNHWVCELDPETRLAVPASVVKALIDAPVLTPIETGSNKNLWGFHGVEWGNTALPAIALSGWTHYRSPLSVCVLILQTPREVASEFAHFGLVCPRLPSVVSGQELSVDHHQFIDWVAVVREMKALF